MRQAVVALGGGGEGSGFKVNLRRRVVFPSSMYLRRSAMCHGSGRVGNSSVTKVLLFSSH